MFEFSFKGKYISMWYLELHLICSKEGLILKWLQCSSQQLFNCPQMLEPHSEPLIHTAHTPTMRLPAQHSPTSQTCPRNTHDAQTQNNTRQNY